MTQITNKDSVIKTAKKCQQFKDKQKNRSKTDSCNIDIATAKQCNYNLERTLYKLSLGKGNATSYSFRKTGTLF